MRRAPALIIMYHRVDDLPDRTGIRVLPENFADQLDVLRRRADIVALRDVLKPSRRPQVAITFDDGFADNLHIALPMLEAAGAPATFFITSGAVDRAEGFWQDRLASLFLDHEPGTRAIEVEIGGRTLWADVRSASARRRAQQAVHARLRARPPAEIEAVVGQIADQLGVTVDRQSVPSILTGDELGRLAARPGVEIGAHTIRHAWLSTLDADAQRDEIAGSRQELEARVGTSVTSFAYPFGSADAFDRTSMALVKEAGFDIAVQAYGACVPRRSNRFRLPRVHIGNWDRERFVIRLGGWLDR